MPPIRIKRVGVSKGYYYWRYRVTITGFCPVEFLIEAKPQEEWRLKEWHRLFARAVSIALAQAEVFDGQTDRPRRK